MRWFSRRGRALGQITTESAIGKWIAILASDSAVKSIVEIGAWHGGGSTAIIAQTISNRLGDGVRAWCLEAHRQRAAEAASRHAHRRNLSVVWGVVVAPNELDSTDLSCEERVWFNEDIEWITQAPNVTSELPEEIDLLVLDGGEFSTYAEFQVLHDRLTGWLLLDDIRTRKCARLFRELSSDAWGDFDLIWQSDERNGTAVFRRSRAF